MTRFVVDATAVLHLASAGIEVPGAHKLLAPMLLRSQTLSALHEAVQRARSRPTSRGTCQISWAGPSTLHSLSCKRTRS
jgi:hypothetical protein